MELYELSRHPKEAADKTNELVHNLIMYDRRRSLCGRARQIGMFWGSLVYLEQCLTDDHHLS